MDADELKSLVERGMKRRHESVLRNPRIAEILYTRGLVERWGIGTQTIVELCVNNGYPEPEYQEQTGSVGVILPRAAPDERAHVGAHETLSPLALRVLRVCLTPRNTSEIIHELGLRKRTGALKRVISMLKKKG